MLLSVCTRKERFDLRIIFSRKVKCSPVEFALEYVFDRKRGISSKTTAENEAEVPGVI